MILAGHLSPKLLITTATAQPPASSALGETVTDLIDRLGGIPPSRIRLWPSPGTATEDDLIGLGGRNDRLFELVDGTLVEKGVGYRESLLAVAIAAALRDFVVPRNLGLVSGADGLLRLFPGLVRGPDVAFVSWDRIPNREVPRAPIPQLIPNLAVEVVSASNTPREMERKRREYFGAGVQLVWQVDPQDRTAAVYTAVDEPVILNESQALDGGNVLPGFTLALRDLFAELDRSGRA